MTRPDWLTDALERHAPKTERDKAKNDRARLQAALRSDRKEDRQAAAAELADRIKPGPGRTPPAKRP